MVSIIYFCHNAINVTVIVKVNDTSTATLLLKEKDKVFKTFGAELTDSTFTILSSKYAPDTGIDGPLKYTLE
jgi:hypothetical protein